MNSHPTVAVAGLVVCEGVEDKTTKKQPHPRLWQSPESNGGISGREIISPVSPDTHRALLCRSHSKTICRVYLRKKSDFESLGFKFAM